jgi:hypothetical protein
MVHIREMTLVESDVIMEYLRGATPEYLDMLGVEPTRQSAAARWREPFVQEYRQLIVIEQRDIVLIISASDGMPIRLARRRWLIDDAIVGGNVEEPAGGLLAIDVRQSIRGFAKARIAVMAQDDCTQFC